MLFLGCRHQQRKKIEAVKAKKAAKKAAKKESVKKEEKRK